MFAQMKLGTKIACGFGGLLVIAVALGGSAIWNMKGVEGDSNLLSKEYAPEVELANHVERDAKETMYEMRGYALTFNHTFYESGMKHLAAVKEHLKACKELAEKSPHLVKLKDAVGTTAAKVAEYEDLVAQTVKNDEAIRACRETLNKEANVFMDSCNTYQESQSARLKKEFREDVGDAKLNERLQKITLVNEVVEAGNACRLIVWKAQALRDAKLIAESATHFEAIEKKIQEMLKLTSQEADRKELAEVSAAAKQYQEAMDKIKENWEVLEAIGKKRGEVGEVVLTQAGETASAGIKQTREIADRASENLSSASNTMVVGLIVAVLVGLVLAVAISRGITTSLNRIIAGLTSASEQVGSSSTQVAQSSQQMAQGASEQASALEETSASLEEMSSMTRQNAENARQANLTANEARSAAEKGREAMQRMSGAINDIKQSSDETAKIIKTIDEIAFQTNLLALNAAVEAARAGEAGKGFAVVAEEVRNLAQRSAEAAKTTSALIEQSKQNSENGVKASTEVAEILKGIFEAAQKVTQLSSEVSTASVEQSKGIEEVNRAVSEMDKVTQGSAANAEESASASEELSAQARELNDMVGELVKMVGGASANGGSHGPARNRFADVSMGTPAPSAAKRSQPHLPGHHGNGNGSGKKKQAAAPAGTNRVRDLVGAKEAKPSEVIPLSENELSEF